MGDDEAKQEAAAQKDIDEAVKFHALGENHWIDGSFEELTGDDHKSLGDSYAAQALQATGQEAKDLHEKAAREYESAVGAYTRAKNQYSDAVTDYQQATTNYIHAADEYLQAELKNINEGPEFRKFWAKNQAQTRNSQSEHAQMEVAHKDQFDAIAKREATLGLYYSESRLAR